MSGPGRKTCLRFAIFALLVLYALTFSHSACKPTARQSGAGERITIAYAATPNAALMHIALVNGYFADEGLDATARSYAFGKMTLDAVLDGKADLATVAITPIVFAVAAGKEISMIAAIETSSRNEAIVARRDRGIAKPSDLAHKKIGVTLGTAGDYFVYSFLLAHDIDKKMVAILDMKPDRMPDELALGRVDAVATWNPVLKQLEKKLGSGGLVLYGEELYTENFIVAAKREFVKARPGAVAKALRALIRAETFAREQPAEARRLVARFTNTDKALLDELWGIYTLRVTLDQALLANLEDQTRWVMKERKPAQSAMPNYLDFIYCDGLQSLRPEAVRIIR